MTPRISIDLPPAPKAFSDRVIDVVNALRAIRYHVAENSFTTDMIDGGVRMVTKQGTADFVRDPQSLLVSYEPDHSQAEGFERIAIRLDSFHFPDAPFLSCDPGSMPSELVKAVEPLVMEGSIRCYDQGEGLFFAVIEGPATDRQVEIERLVEDLSNGTDAAVGGSWTLRRRWPAMGVQGLADPVSAENVAYKVPDADHPSELMRHARARILMIRGWMQQIAPAIVVFQESDDVMGLMPYSMTRKPAEPNRMAEVRRASVAAFHALSQMERED